MTPLPRRCRLGGHRPGHQLGEQALGPLPPRRRGGGRRAAGGGGAEFAVGGAGAGYAGGGGSRGRVRRQTWVVSVPTALLAPGGQREKCTRGDGTRTRLLRTSRRFGGHLTGGSL